MFPVVWCSSCQKSKPPPGENNKYPPTDPIYAHRFLEGCIYYFFAQLSKLCRHKVWVKCIVHTSDHIATKMRIVEGRVRFLLSLYARGDFIKIKRYRGYKSDQKKKRSNEQTHKLEQTITCCSCTSASIESGNSHQDRAKRRKKNFIRTWPMDTRRK